MSISECIEALVDYEGSQRKFAEKTGIAQTTISRMVSKQGNIRSDNILAIVEAYPNLNVKWLITGEGEMWISENEQPRETPLSDDEKEAMKDEMIELLKFQVNTMKKAILEKAPELAKYLNLED